MVSKAQTTADSFVTVLKALPRRERDAVLVRIAQDKEFTQDILDLATIAQRRHEPSRPFHEYLANRKRK